MRRKSRTWTEREVKYLHCPISAWALSRGALWTRTRDSIHAKRRALGIGWGHHYTGVRGPFDEKERGWELTDFPDVDWNQSLMKLRKVTGLGETACHRLRKEASRLGATKRVHRTGRRPYSYADFDVDWSANTASLMRETGLCRTVVYRLRREFEAGKVDKNGK